MRNIRGPKYQLRVNNPDAISIDVLESIQSQYAASPRILALLVKKAALADPGKDFMVWYHHVFDPTTAEGVGLDIWGRIVGAVRTLAIEQKPFGFTPSRLQPFDQGVFYNGQPIYASSTLNDAEFRTLIFWKAAANIGSAEAPALNFLLQRLFPEKTCYVLETGIMHIRVVSEFELEEIHRAIFRRYGLLAKGAGVGVEWLEVPRPCLGFADSGLDTFNNGTFYAGQILNYTPV